MGTTGWSVVIAIVTPAAASLPGHLGPAGEQRADDDRDGFRGDQVGQQVRLGAVVDHQLVPELPGEADRGRDVVRAVAVLAPRNLAAQHAADRLQVQVAVHRLAVGRRAVLGGGQAGQVVPGPDEGFPDHPGRAQPGGRRLVPVSVDALRVLAERRLQAGRRAQHHLVNGAAPALDGRGLAADRVAGARVDVHREHAAADGVTEALVGRVDRVEGPNVGGHRAGHLVDVPAGPALGLLGQADMSVRVDEAGQHPLACCVDHLGVVGYRETRPIDGDDLSRLEQDSSAVDGLAFHRDDPGAHNRLAHAVFPARFRGPTRLSIPLHDRLPSSLVPRSSAQAAPRPSISFMPPRDPSPR